MAKAIINTARNQGKISKYIYGQFAEHLGRCIYEGLYVDENSDIPNKNGMRCDVVNALKELEIPVLRWPGGGFADDYHSVSYTHLDVYKRQHHTLPARINHVT